jgi:predicted nucleotidyltransferase component of viral defense system
MMNDLGKPKRPGIIEKDYNLHRLLGRIQEDEYLSENLAFKGGTCLIKAHIGYFRFSEDIDFSWKDRAIWEGKSQSATKRSCSKEIAQILLRFSSIGNDLGLEFKGQKDDPKEVHLSSGGRMMVLYMGYHSELFDRTDRVKIEVNLVEDLYYPVRNMNLRTYLESLRSDELRFLFKDQFESYSRSVNIPCYDTREIFIEKCRAALTRKVSKLRDFIDIHYLKEKYGLRIEDLEDQIISKTRFSIDLYKRYRENLELAVLPASIPEANDELDLLIIDPPGDMMKGIVSIQNELDEIRKVI